MLQNATYFQELQAYKDRYRVYENRPVEELYQELLQGASYISKSGKAMIDRAYALAQKSHLNQKRKSGSPYITHPLTIACMALSHQPCEILLSAILLHDVLEDTTTTYKEIADIHPAIAHIVEGATKIRSVSRHHEKDATGEGEKFETLRKILIASQKDIRILFLKVFDRFHNMITLDAMEPEKAQRIAQETRSVYVPLAKRCGLREVHHYLQGLSLQVLEPEKWETMKTFVENKETEMRKTAKEIINYLSSQSWSKPLAYDVRFLSPFSVELTKVFQENSWYCIQIIVEDAADCYAIVHDIGQKKDENFLQIGRVNDLINQPRLSEYMGLHFDVIFRGIHKIKVRVLTRETYTRIQTYPTFDDLGVVYSPVLFRDFDLINEATSSDSSDFMKSVTEHILARKIPLHSEPRPLFYMPIKSTAIDAAIYLFPDKFSSITDVYRNGEKVPLHTILENNDIITVFFDEEKRTIKKEWIEFSHSGVSKWRIKNALA